MCKDISTQYTKMKNKEQGRHGYGMWKREKDTVIRPNEYGRFLQRKRKRK